MEPLEFDDPHAREMIKDHVKPYINQARPKRLLDLEYDNRWRIDNLTNPPDVPYIVAPEYPASDTLSGLARSREWKGYFDFILAVGMFERLTFAQEGIEQLKDLLNERSGRLVIVYRDYAAMMAMYEPQAEEVNRHSERTSIRLSGGIPSEYVAARKPETMWSLARNAGLEILSTEPIRIPYWIADVDARYQKGDTYFHLMALRIK